MTARQDQLARPDSSIDRNGKLLLVYYVTRRRKNLAQNVDIGICYWCQWSKNEVKNNRLDMVGNSSFDDRRHAKCNGPLRGS